MFNERERKIVDGITKKKEKKRAQQESSKCKFILLEERQHWLFAICILLSCIYLYLRCAFAFTRSFEMIPSPHLYIHTQTHIIVNMSLWAIQKLCKKPRSQILQLLHSFIPSDLHVVLITMIIVPRQEYSLQRPSVKYFLISNGLALNHMAWLSRILFYNEHTFEEFVHRFHFQNNEIPHFRWPNI